MVQCGNGEAGVIGAQLAGSKAERAEVNSASERVVSGNELEIDTKGSPLAH